MLKEYMKPPPEQLFWRVLSYCLHLICMMDRRWWGYKVDKLLIITQIIMHYFTPVVLVSQVSYLYWNIGDISSHQLQTILITICINSIINAKLFASKSTEYAKIMKNFWNDIHIYHHQTDEFSKEKLYRCEFYVRTMTIALALSIGLDCFMLNAVALYYNIHNKDIINDKSGKLMSALYLIMPFDYEYNYNNWLIILCLNSYLFMLAGFFLTVSDIICFAIILHLIGHIQIFKYRIRMFSETFDELDEDTVTKRIVELVKYHSFLKRSFQDTKDGFGVNISSNYLLNFVMDSLILYQCMTRDATNAFVYSLMLFVFMGGLVLMSFILEEIRKQSDGLADAIYFLPWEKMSVCNQKMILLILGRVQPELSFIGAGQLRTGLKPMLNIMKSTFSYYIILKQKV